MTINSSFSSHKIEHNGPPDEELPPEDELEEELEDEEVFKMH